MFQEQDNLSTMPLAPDDLDLLRTFLEAWCDEHSVDVTDEAAADVASALIAWYQSDASDRTLLKPEPSKPLPASPRIQLLLQQLKQTRGIK
ncbi:hypothetical protein EPK99_06915 [Neorhizobium lilium]|uniref:Uncharacterized protein n=1 Tax=Neorhizobium lilium TaxID=2503024 RepID=A0A444LH38_9HYPH|nr:hypothetical protein [Neorhizobium lilium]RWX78346.1 hypothetical protein EPK99_06915 [Neorhizobium lilium]